MKIQPHNIDKFRDRSTEKRRINKRFRMTEKAMREEKDKKNRFRGTKKNKFRL